MRATLVQVALGCLALQILSATFLVTRFDSPNAATEVARNLEAGRGFTVAAWFHTPRRAFHLPGEPLWLAAGFKTLPEPLHRYLHLPVVVILVVSIASIAFVIGGRRLALVAAALAMLDPFVVVHGPVWDDTLLAAALEWLIVAMLVQELDTHAPSNLRWRVLAVAALSGYAAVTRLQAELDLVLVAAVLLAAPSFRRCRPAAVAILSGIAGAVALWSLRNVLVLGVLVAGSTHDGQTLWQANHPDARGSLFQTGVTQTTADMSLSAPLDEVAEDAAFRGRAMEYFRSQPFDALATAVVKVAVSLVGIDFGSSVAGPRNVVSLLWNGALLAAAVAGAFVWRRRARGFLQTRLAGVVALLVAMSSLVMLALGPAGLRYRISLAPVLYLAAAFAISVGSQVLRFRGAAVRSEF